MKKPRWSNKWQGLSDMHRARAAARGTTTESTTMARSGASDVTTIARQMPSISFQERIQAAERVMMEMEQMRDYLHRWNVRQQPLSRQTLWSIPPITESQSPSFSPQEDDIFQEPMPSSSSTKELMESCAALKQGPLVVQGATTPSILTGDQPTTSSTSSETGVRNW